MNTYGVIMAGGGGTRFWPLSRNENPKQFLNLTGKELMVNEAVDRLARSIKKENIFIVTNKMQAEKMRTVTEGRVAKDHILEEPAARNTAACIGYAAMEIIRKYGDGVMCIVPSDPYIKDEEEFKRVMDQSILVAEETEKLVTIGITPSFPSTGYGYIRYQELEHDRYCKVEEFVEKPDVETAADYIESGLYSWNSGMFIWKASTIMDYYKNLLPDVYVCLEEIGEAMFTEQEHSVIERVYPEIPKISVDYGIMERAKGILMLKGDFGWSDVGSWDALDTLYQSDEEGNICYGKNQLIDTKNCIIYAKNKLIAAVGVENMIIVETEDAILVCDKEKAQQVKEVVAALEEKGWTEYL